MNQEQLKTIQETPGFIAALDQSGGSTPGALARYGISEEAYSSEDEMFDLVQDMRARIITSPAFSSDKIIGAILFERTMDSKIEGKYTGDVLAEKGIVPFIKVDQGLADEENGVQLMKELDRLDDLLQRSKQRNMFGTKMRSVIHSYNKAGIQAIVDQQFEVGKRILDQGLVPILEPEVNIQAENRAQIDQALTEELLKHLDQLADDQKVMLKLSIPEEANTYQALIDHPNVLRVVALSGGYTTEEANEKLAENKGLIASFSRALLQDLNVDQSDEEFDRALEGAITSIYQASIQ